MNSTSHSSKLICPHSYLKVPSACLHNSGMEYDHPNRLKDPVTAKWTREYFNNYVSQSKEVFTLLSRHVHDALTWCDKTCPLPEWSSPRVEIDQNTDLSLLSNTPQN